MYNASIMKRFINPQNSGIIRKADAVGKAVCDDKGDIVKFYLRVNPQTYVIEDVNFKTLGCPAAIACSDVACDLIKGRTLQQAQQLVYTEIIENLNDFPPQKISCATTVETAIKETINNYYKRENKK